MAFNLLNPDPVDQTREQYDGPDQNQFKSVYNVGAYEYPFGLRTKDDLQHYVAFFINVREKSQLGRRYKNANKLFDLSEDQRRTSAALSTQDFSLAAQNILNNPALIGAGFSLLKNLTTGKVLKNPIGTVTEAAFTAGTTALAAAGIKELSSDQITATNSTYRLKEVITLYLENSPSVRYGVNYTEKELGSLTGLLAQGSAAAAAGKLTGEFGKEAVSRILADLIKLPSIIPGGGTLADLRELSTRAKTNPFREVLFESVDYRTFSFRYRFFPASQEESLKIRNIIKLFKLHMHPEISDDKFFYMYPSEFEIKYYYKDKENQYMNRIGRCALVGMDVEYGGDQFATFEDGAPVEIGMTLTFRELEQITSQGVEKYGY